eukprot:CAMPEP_0195523840 /NCGR_PEP_ID=MMETSP0794_2-20130614/23298_1 /TAXON_ID=515487 /ORGANISM="Stephanopyxis turris, Strain CCMP 815" /LENGTH=184 /DNA_ID=CAMNT_0040653925 /DNA_START=124 /DNA_END=678 /DNA_ORIENTATION=-
MNNLITSNFFLSVLAAAIAVASAARKEDGERMAKAREDSRPFYLREVDVMGIPIQPTTIILTVACIIILYRGLTKQSTARASHILLDGSSDETKAKLEKIKKEIGNDPKKFEEAAKKYSTCPSGKSAGGCLGTFAMGSMAPPFDKVVFDRKRELGVVQGPVQTHFGWHLILIHERDDQRQLVVE